MLSKELVAYSFVNGLTIARAVLGFLASQSIQSAEWGAAAGQAIIGAATEIDGTLAERFDVASEFGFQLDCLCDAIYGGLIANALANQMFSMEPSLTHDILFLGPGIIIVYYILAQGNHRRHST